MRSFKQVRCIDLLFQLDSVESMKIIHEDFVDSRLDKKYDKRSHVGHLSLSATSL